MTRQEIINYLKILKDQSIALSNLDYDYNAKREVMEEELNKLHSKIRGQFQEGMRNSGKSASTILKEELTKILLTEAGLDDLL